MTITAITESAGECLLCGEKAVLGDGLCVDCWDDIDYPCHSQSSRQILRNLDIKRLNDAGMNYTAIGRMHGLRPETVKKIILHMRKIGGE